MAQDLEIKASVTGLDKVEKGLEGVADAAKKTDAAVKPLSKDLDAVAVSAAKISPASTTASKALAATAISANKLDSSLSGSVKGSNQASQALTNLGRVAQDAPFGFIGIANNLNPLLESFQRLKVEAGSSGGALKALGASLIGGGGIGLALSAVTAIVSFASVGFSAWTRGLSANKAQLDINEKAAKDTADALQSIISTVAKEVSSVEILVTAFNKENISRKEKQNIIEKLQQISPAYFSNLDKEKVTVGQLETAYNAYSNSIIRSIELKVREKDLNKVIEERLALQDKGNKLTNITIDANGKLQKSYNAVYDPERQNAGFKTLVLTSKEQERLNVLLQTEKQLLDQIGNLQKPQDFISGKKDKATTKKEVKETVADIISALDQELSDIDAFSKIFGTNDFNKTKDKIAAITTAAKKLVKDFNLSPDDTIIAKLVGNVSSDLFRGGRFFENLKDLDLRSQLVEKLETAAKGVPLEIKIPILPKVKIPSVALIEAQIAFASFRDSVNKTAADTFTDIATQIGDALGNALANGVNKDFFNSLFGGILQSLGKGIRQIGIQALVATKAILLIKKTIGTVPGLGAAIGLIALGTLISALGSKLSTPAFATGGVTSGGTILVGERGPELISAPGGSRITPNSQTNSILGSGQNVTVSGVLTADGKKLVVVLDNARQSLRNQN